jgi:hypothetical protein
MINHFLRKGYLSELEDYLSELEGKPKIKLGNRDKQFLQYMLYKPKYLSSLHKHVNELYDDEDARNIKKSTDAKHAPHYLLAGPMRKPATHKAIRKLLNYELIKPINKKSLENKGLLEGLDDANLTREEFFAANRKRAKLFDITEYGLFCFLSQAFDFTPSMLGLRWQSKTMKLLLSPYFEEKTVLGRLTTLEYDVINRFLIEALLIIKRRVDIIDNVDESEIYIHDELNKSKKGKKRRTWKEEEIASLEDDLEWHAKSFALRLMVNTASNDRDKSEESRNKLSFLFHDKKFLKLAEDTTHEILSVYRGGKLLELDKTLHP